jgi:hypothetical protein
LRGFSGQAEAQRAIFGQNAQRSTRRHSRDGQYYCRKKRHQSIATDITFDLIFGSHRQGLSASVGLDIASCLSNEFTISFIMAKSISDIEKHRKKLTGRGPGRPRTVVTSVLVRLEADDVARLDAWIARREKELGLKVGRGAAIRACLKMTLK